MEKQLEMLKALAHPVRLNIVYALKDCEFRCVCELQEIQNDVSQSNLSQHLRILREAEIVITKKVGGWVNYSLKNKNIIKILEEFKEI